MFTHTLAAGYELGVGRPVPSAAAIVGLVSVVLAVLTMRSSGRLGIGNGRAGAAMALVLGLAAAVVGGLHGATAAGGLGTGNGLAGAVVALALGLLGAILAGLGLMRSRRASRTMSPESRESK